MSLDAKFDTACANAKNLVSKPSDEELLKLYALFKQATVGDCNTTKPGLFDFKGAAKWDAWNKKKGTSQDDAKKAYCDLVDELVAKYGLK